MNFFLVIFTQNELTYRLVKPDRRFFFFLIYPKEVTLFLSSGKGMNFFYLYEMSNFIFNFKIFVRFSFKKKKQKFEIKN